MDKIKPYTISKQVVLEAFRRVKANGGASGVDQISLEKFESNLRNNLYIIWNRMSSGSYFPPPVQAVEIPKKSGGTRTLGIPKWRTVWRRWLEKYILNHASNSTFTGIPMDTDRESRP